MKINWKQLEEKGYLVLEACLDSKQVEALVNDVTQKHKHIRTANTSQTKFSLVKEFTPISDSVAEKLRKFVTKSCQKINSETNLTIGTQMKNSTYVENASNFNWHSDSLMQYMYQQTYNHLNFWIPVIKENREKSGLEVLCMEKIKKKEPNLYRSIKGKGAVFLRGNGPVLQETVNGLIGHELKTNVSELKTTISSSVGDVVLLRGDVIHKTQDTLTPRTALTFRCYDSNHKVKKDLFINPTLGQSFRMRQSPSLFKRIIAAFSQTGKDSLAQHEIDEFIDRLPNETENEEWRRVKSIKLHENKIVFRNHELGSNVRNTKLLDDLAIHMNLKKGKIEDVFITHGPLEIDHKDVVIDYLVSKGIAPNRLKTIVDNDIPKGNIFFDSSDAKGNLTRL